MTVDLSSYKPLYIQTAREYITQMTTGLQRMMTAPDDKASIESIHIAAHSLSSQSQIMNYLQIAAICKHIETLFRGIKDGTHPAPTAAQLPILQEVTGALMQAIITLESDTLPDLSHELTAVQSLS